MSTILKALQRLEDEKRAKPDLTLEEQIATPPPSGPPQRRGWLVAVGIGVAGIAVAVGAIFWIAPDSAIEAESPAVSASPSPTRPVVSIPTAPDPAQLVGSEPDPPSAVARSLGASSGAPPESSRVEVVKRLSPPAKLDVKLLSPLASPDEPAVRKRASVPADSAAKTHVVASARNTAPKRSPATPSGSALQSGAPSTGRGTATARSTIDKSSTANKSSAINKSSASAKRTSTMPPAPTPAAEREPSPAPLQVASAKPATPPSTHPPASELATGNAMEPDHKVVLRAKLPKLKVRSTIWHPQSSRRITVVEVDAGQVLELNEGDAVGPLVVESIKPGGVFFMHDGVSVLHKVGR